VFETMGSRSKRRACVQPHQLVSALCAGVQAHRLALGLCQCWSMWVGCVGVMLLLTRRCCEEVEGKRSEEIRRRAMYGSPPHAPGGSPTPWFSSRIFLHQPQPPFPTSTLRRCEKTAYIPCWRGEAGWWLLARNASAWGPKI